MKHVGLKTRTLDIAALKNTGTSGVVYVSKSGTADGDGSIARPFNSVTNAMNSITTATVTNRVVIYVSPGTYTEGAISIKPNVFIVGESIHASRLNCTSIALDASWTSTLDNRCGFQSIGITLTQENLSNGHSSPYGMTLDFQTKGSTQGKAYFEDVLLFGTLYTNGNTNQVNQLWFKNMYFYKAVTFDGVKSYHAGNTYFSTIKGIGTRSVFYVNGPTPRWSMTLESGATVDALTSSTNSADIAYASPNTMLMKYAMGESKTNVKDMLYEFENQHFGNFFNIYMNAQKALRGYAIDEAQRLGYNKVYYDDYGVYDGSEAVASGGAQLYYAYGARGSETDNNGKITSPLITGFPTDETTCILMATPTLGAPDITFEYSRNGGTTWNAISLDTATTIPSGVSFKIRVNLREWSWNFGWALLFNSV